MSKYKPKWDQERLLPYTCKLSVHYNKIVTASLNKLHIPSRHECFLLLQNSSFYPLVQRRYACCGEATVLLCFKSLLHTELHEDASYKQSLRCPQQRSQWFSYLLQEFCPLNSTKQSTISLSVKQTKDRIKICHDGLLSEIPATRYSLPYCHKIQSRRRH